MESPTSDPTTENEAREPVGGPSAPVGTDARAAELENERYEAVALFQRATADYQNLRRRLSSDIDAAVARAKKPLHQELLLVLDYLDMALATPCTTPEGKNLLAGVTMTRTQLAGLLEREGIQAVPEKKTFDPALHQAVERVETKDVPAGTILATLRRGYTVGGQILRAAQVKVAVEPNADVQDAGADGAL
ncbi:MAG: nucleotide exchange factor GrpE [Planctomycetes bacterium]|nr:nucleotide exchange factor GrpE [Planctomycetota bacterium]